LAPGICCFHHRSRFRQTFQFAMDRHPSWIRHARFWLVLAGACAASLPLWVPWESGRAFVLPAPLGVSSMQKQNVARPVRSAAPFVEDQGGRAAWSLSAAGCALFLCSMAVRQGGLGRGCRAQQGSRRWQVTTCHAFGPATTCFSSPEYRRPAATEDGPHLQTTIAETPRKVSFSVPNVVPTSVNLLEPLLAEKSEESTIMNHRQVRALPAFCVSGVRTTRGQRGASRRNASAARTGRTARRSMGARLQPAHEVSSGSSLAYDPSRTRTKIQQGLRAGRYPAGKSAHHRECKAPVACSRMVDQSGELFEAHLGIVASMFTES